MRYELTYIYHDCFMIETPEAVIIFDYWKDPLSFSAPIVNDKKEGTETTGRNFKDFPPLLDEINTDKPLYLIVSHHHKDHFSRRIFLWSKWFDDITFIISKDVYRAVRYMLVEHGTYEGHKPPLDRVHVLTPGEVFEDRNIKVKAFGSTDIGNSYAVETSGVSIFHAGDLNAWLWLDESTPREIEDAENAFNEIVDRIRAEFPSFDLVMFPVDSRQGREYWRGARYFVNKILTTLFVPMHFELVVNEDEKEQRRLDAAAFSLFARRDYGAYLQLASTRARYLVCD